MRITFKIKINSGPKKGQIVEIVMFDLDYFHSNSIADLLIEKDHLDCWCNDDEFEVLSTEILSDEQIRFKDFKVKEKCKHELVSREYASQPYGHCLGCNQTVNF